MRPLLRLMMDALGALAWMLCTLVTAWMVLTEHATLGRALGTGMLLLVGALCEAAAVMLWMPRGGNATNATVVGLMHALLSTTLRLGYTLLGIAAALRFVRHPTETLLIAALAAGAVVLRLLYSGVDVAAHSALRARGTWFGYPWAVALLLTPSGVATLGGRWALSTASWLLFPVALMCLQGGVAQPALWALGIALALGQAATVIQRRHVRVTAVELRRLARV